MPRSRGLDLKVVPEDLIQEELIVCPFCLEPQGNKLVCCGEVRFTKAYVFRDEVYLDTEIVVLKPKKGRQLCFTDMETSTKIT